MIRAGLVSASALLLAFIVLPLGGLVGRLSPAQFLAGLATDSARTALQLSALTTVVSLAITVALGTPLAYVLARAEFRGRRLVDALVDLPIVVPPAVAGLALLLVFGRLGLFGPTLSALGIRLSFTTAAVVMAQVFVASPFLRAGRPDGISERRPVARGRFGDARNGTVAHVCVRDCTAGNTALIGGRCCRGRARWANSVPRSCLPAISRASPRPYRSTSTST